MSSSDWGVMGTEPLEDLEDHPKILFTRFLMDNWSDTVSGVKKVNIDFGYEPGINSTKPFIIKCEENFTDIAGIDLGDRNAEFNHIMDVHIWMMDTKYKTTMGYPGFVNYLWRMRRYMEQFIKSNRNNMKGPYKIKHLYLVGSTEVREPERTDWHHAIVTFQMQLFKTYTGI